METSIFPDKSEKPDDSMILTALGEMSIIWQSIRSYVFQVYPNAFEE